jgi:hypothetical protein
MEDKITIGPSFRGKNTITPYLFGIEGEEDNIKNICCS